MEQNVYCRCIYNEVCYVIISCGAGYEQIIIMGHFTMYTSMSRSLFANLALYQLSWCEQLCDWKEVMEVTLRPDFKNLLQRVTRLSGSARLENHSCPNAFGQLWFTMTLRLVDRLQIVGHLKCIAKWILSRPKGGLNHLWLWACISMTIIKRMLTKQVLLEVHWEIVLEQYLIPGKTYLATFLTFLPKPWNHGTPSWAVM